MSLGTDTLDIAPMRRAPTLDAPALPIAAVQREEAVNHPEAAAMARARIAAVSGVAAVPELAEAPALPTSELVLDRDVLARQLRAVPAARRRPLPPWAQSMLTAAGIFVTLLLLFKSPVILSQISYLTTKPTPAPVVGQAAASVIPAAPSISIPKINVNVPVVYEASVAEADVQQALQSGIDHYGNTPPPGRNGNAVFFGHSSNDWWEPGNYKFVFVLLDKLAPGDQFTINYQSKRYTYEVTGSKVVDPTDLSVLAQTPTPTVTLITCSPPGTSWKRLIVTAKQIDPDPSKVANAPAANAAAGSASLPGAAPSFLNEVGQAWTGLVHGVGSLFGIGGSSSSSSGGAASTSPQASPAQLPAAN